MVWIEIVCDRCNDAPWGESYRRGSVQRLKEITKQCGWKTIKGKLYCPNCQAIIEIGKENEDE